MRDLPAYKGDLGERFSAQIKAELINVLPKSLAGYCFANWKGHLWGFPYGIVNFMIFFKKKGYFGCVCDFA